MNIRIWDHDVVFAKFPPLKLSDTKVGTYKHMFIVQVVCKNKKNLYSKLDDFLIFDDEV